MQGCRRLVDVGRRQFLRGGAFAAVGAATGTVVTTQALSKPLPARVDYPSMKIGTVAQLKPNAPIDITYPDKDSPGVLIKLGTRVPGGCRASIWMERAGSVAPDDSH